MLQQKIFYNTFISLGARVVSVIIGLFIINLTTRYLGQSGFGDFSTVLAFLFIFYVLADLGLYSITIRDIAKADGQQERIIISRIFTFRLLSSLIFFVLACLVGFLFPYSWPIKIGIFIAALGNWAMSVTQIVIVIFQKYLKMEEVALAECLSRFIQLAIIFLFIRWQFGFFGIIWAFSIVSVLNLLFLYCFSLKYVPIKFKIDLNSWVSVLKESYPMALGAILTMFYFKFDTVMLSLMKTSADVGIYSLPYRILEVLIFLPSIFTGLVMPLMSKYIDADKDKFKRVIQKAFDALLIVAMPLVIGTLLLSKKIIVFISSAEFIKSAGVLNILIFATAIIFISHLFYNIIVVINRQKSFIWIFALGAILNIGLNLLLIPRYSYYATAWNTVITELVVALSMAFVIFKGLKYLLSVRLIIKALSASLMMGLIIYFAPAWHLLIILPIGLLVYFIFLYLFKGITREDILIIIKKSPEIN